MHLVIRLGALSASLMLAACGSGDDVPANAGVTAEEALALDNAANMLDTSPDSLIADVPPGNGDAGEEVANTGELPVSSEDATEAE